MVEQARLLAACTKVRRDLLDRRSAVGHWVGELSSSAMATATAVSALAMAERYDPTDARSGRFVDEPRESQLAAYIVGGLRWLAAHQNEDGGWGDTDRSRSNIATTMLAVSAFHLTGVPADRADLLERANRYIATQGGRNGLRRWYGNDRTLLVPILANCALAGLVPWKSVPALPFELACLPRWAQRVAVLPDVGYGIPTLVAVGQAKFLRHKPRNPVWRLWRSAAIRPSLDVLVRTLSDNGGYVEAVPLTSFVVMNLAGTGRAAHRVAQRGVDFLLATGRADGGWPIYANLAARNTALAVGALSAAGDGGWPGEFDCLDWLLGCQHQTPHALTGAKPGGWGCSDPSGAAARRRRYGGGAVGAGPLVPSVVV